MQRKFTSGSRQAPDPYDQFLEENNYFRKHTARDSSCLFRVISEQMYDTQIHHLEIRKKCVQYIAKHRKLFQILIEKDLDEYLDDLSKPKTYGTLVELQAIGYMFKRNIILFEPFNLGNYLNKRNYYDGVFRVFYTPERHFDSVFTADYIKDAAICQSICYEILYTEIFKLPDVGFAVEQMLHSNCLEDIVVQTEFNNEGYCKRIFLRDGRVFNMDLPTNTNCILENYEWCHFHCVNFPRISNDLQQELMYYKNGNKYNDQNNVMSLNRTADPLLPNKYISCVRQLLKEGITPFPYKVAKALDANMYRNIEFDVWNEARKENKYSNWYNGDNNFKVGAKCYVRLHNSDEELYTCHIQAISIDKDYCLVFIERLGEKRLVPYDALSPLPPEEFKPWVIPYSWQRSSIHRQNKSINKYDRHLYCSIRSHYIRTNGDIRNKPIYHTNSPYYGHEKIGSADCNNLRHLLHLDNFPAQSMHYYTMPLSITHAVQEASNINQLQDNNATNTHTQSHSQINTNTTNNELSVNIQSEATTNVAGALNNDHIVEDCEQVVAQNEPNEEAVDGGYYVPQYPAYYGDDYNVYYGNNASQTVTTGYVNGGMMYFMNNQAPQPQTYESNVYMPATIMPSNAGIMSYNATPTSYYTATPNEPYSYENNDLVKIEGDTSQITPAMRDLRVANATSTPIFMSTTSINYEARPSLCPHGDDLPVDLATLRYFYNLGIDYHRKLMLPRESVHDSCDVRNAKTPVSQIADNMRNIILDENANLQEADANNNTETVGNANLESAAGSMVIKTNNNNNNNEMNNHYNKNNNNKMKDNITSASCGQSSNNENVPPKRNDHFNAGYNYYNYHNNNNHHLVGNRRFPNTRQFNQGRYNSRHLNSESSGGNSGGLLKTSQYHRGYNSNVIYEHNGGKPHYRNTYKKNNSTTDHNYNNSSYAYGSNNSHTHTRNTTTSIGNSNANYSAQSPLFINTTSVVEPTYTESSIRTQSTVSDFASTIPVTQTYVPISTNMTQNYNSGYNEFSAGNAATTPGVYLPPPMPQQPYCVYTMQPPAANQAAVMPSAAGPYVPPQLPPHQTPFYYGRGGYSREDTEATGHEVNNGVVMPCYSYPSAVPIYYTPPPSAPTNALLPTPTSTSSQNYWSMPPPTLTQQGPLQTGTVNAMHTLNGISCTAHSNNNSNQYMPTISTAAAPQTLSSSAMKISHRREKAA